MIAPIPTRVLALLEAHQVKPRRASTAHRAVTSRVGPVVSLDQLSRARVLRYTDKVGYGLSDGRKTAGYRLACFYLADVGLATHLAAHCLALWNGLNAPPLSMGVLDSILQNAGKYAKGAA